MKKLLFIFGILLAILDLSAQKYAVHFTDKNNSPYNINEPLNFLSQRALDRRAKFNIAITEEDFPVNPNYLTEIQGLGAQLLFSSRWLNCALVIADVNTIQAIEQLPFVEKTVFVSPGTSIVKAKGDVSKNDKFKELVVTQQLRKNTSSDYGAAYNQIQQLNGIALHEMGFMGEGMIIAILDGGFDGVDQINAFEPLFTSNRILMTKDFVNPEGNVYSTGSNGGLHGTFVLSCIGSYLPGSIIGTAPNASFCLFRTEDGNSENLIECYNWVIGAETADSIGADVINSSLGYSTFDDPSMDYTYAQMDGMTAVSSIGATKLIQRGVSMVVSAGNSNGTNWPWVGTPSDVPEALTIGAVNSNGEIAYFSSIGPNGAGEQKPDVVALGVSASVVAPNNNIYSANGTSFSSPITCGMTTCLMQAFPNKTPEEIKSQIQRSASQWNNPDIYYGYGIPDFYAAYQALAAIEEYDKNISYKIYPNPTSTEFHIDAKEPINEITLYNILGKQILTQKQNNKEITINSHQLEHGIYILKITFENGKTEFSKIVKQ